MCQEAGRRILDAKISLLSAWSYRGLWRWRCPFAPRGLWRCALPICPKPLPGHIEGFGAAHLPQALVCPKSPKKAGQGRDYSLSHLTVDDPGSHLSIENFGSINLMATWHDHNQFVALQD